MPRVHLLIGPVGAGKSTYAQRLEASLPAVVFNLDEWMARLFQDDRPGEGEAMATRIAWYSQRTGRCIEQIWALTTKVLALNVDVVLEIGLLRRAERRAFYEKLEAGCVDVTVYVVDVPVEVRRKRVQRRNAEKGNTFSMVVPPAIFELASGLWEPPDDAERRHLAVVDVD